jgi:hypothetical protein
MFTAIHTSNLRKNASLKKVAQAAVKDSNRAWRLWKETDNNGWLELFHTMRRVSEHLTRLAGIDPEDDGTK